MAPTFFIGRTLNGQNREWLLQNKVSFEEHPLIYIKFVCPEIEKLAEWKKNKKHIVISSAWAAKWFVLNFLNLAFSEKDAVFCLSEKQKQILRPVTKNSFVAPEQNSVSLATLVKGKNSGETIVFLHGNKTLDVIFSELNVPEYQFQSFEVYKNSFLKNAVDKDFDVYLFFSPSGVESFVESGNSILPTSKIVAIGNTTAETCKTNFESEVFVPKKQDELSMLKYAVELQGLSLKEK